MQAEKHSESLFEAQNYSEQAIQTHTHNLQLMMHALKHKKVHAHVYCMDMVHSSKHNTQTERCIL